MEAQTLNCPSCGAAVSQDSTQCQYCHALLQTVACPSCFGLMFRGSQFCPHCGAKADFEHLGATTGRHCPRCNNRLALNNIAVGKFKLEECLHCGGLWVDAATFQQICADKEAEAAAVDLKLPQAPSQIDAHVHYLNCPQCGNLMNRVNFAHRSGVIINTCGKHGIWFDRDELRKIIEFIRAGGMERARELDKEEALGAVREAAGSRNLSMALEGDLSSRDPYSLDDHVNYLGDVVSFLGWLVGRWL